MFSSLFHVQTVKYWKFVPRVRHARGYPKMTSPACGSIPSLLSIPFHFAWDKCIGYCLRFYIEANGCAHWAIPLFNYTPLQMTINGVQGDIGNMSRGVVIYIPVPGGGGGGGGGGG